MNKGFAAICHILPLLTTSQCHLVSIFESSLPLPNTNSHIKFQKNPSRASWVIAWTRNLPHFATFCHNSATWCPFSKAAFPYPAFPYPIPIYISNFKTIRQSILELWHEQGMFAKFCHILPLCATTQCHLVSVFEGSLPLPNTNPYIKFQKNPSKHSWIIT